MCAAGCLYYWWFAVCGTWTACGEDETKGGARKRSIAKTPTATPSQPATTGGEELAVGEMVSVAGGGSELGDGGPATAAGFCGPGDVALDAAGNLNIADLGVECQGPGGGSVRKVDAAEVITTVAGGHGYVGVWR